MLSKGTVASSFPHQFRRTIELIEHYQFFITSSTILTYIYNIIIYIIYIIYICSNIFQLVPCLFLEIQHVHVVPGVRSVSWGSLGLSRWSSHGILQARENIPRAVGVRWFNMFNYHTMCTLKHLKTRYLEAFGCIWHRLYRPYRYCNRSCHFVDGKQNDFEETWSCWRPSRQRRVAACATKIYW